MVVQHDARILNEAAEDRRGAPWATVVVANYRRPELVARCLESLYRAPEIERGEFETVVVDDGSGDGSLPGLAASYPWATFVVRSSNGGYASAVNTGMHVARGEWVLTLNNDTTIEPNALTELRVVAESSPSIGCVSALMLFAGGRRGGTINSAGLELDRLGLPYDRLLGFPADAAGAQPVDIFGSSGGAALYRRAMLDAVGGVDESFGAYFEDADLSWRAAMAGWRCVLVPTGLVHHHHAGTIGHLSDYKYWYVGRNRIRLLAKNATTAHLLRVSLRIAAYECAYVTYVAVADRTLAPLRGRMRGLREWRASRRLVDERRPIEMAPVQGFAGALRRRRTWVG